MPINSIDSNLNPGSKHMIALYYCYPPTDISNPDDHASFHQDVCTTLNLGGRIRVSHEGINGVLSGPIEDLKEYELRLRRELANDNGVEEEEEATKQTYEYLDIKYCHLRQDIPVEQQLFDSLNVKVTKEVVSLFDFSAPGLNQGKKNKRCRQRRRQRRKEKKLNEAIGEGKANTDVEKTRAPDHVNPIDSSLIDHNEPRETQNQFPDVEVGTAFTIQNWEQYTPAEHLSPSEWNDKLLTLSQNISKSNQNEYQEEEHEISQVDKDAILLDARNIYETRVGHFAVPNLPTFFPNTRKFSSLPMALNTSEAAEALAGKKVFMYCTGGIRCERAGSYLRALSESNKGAWKDKEPPKGIYQLKGGIQRYLESYGESSENNNDDGTPDASREIQKEAAPCLYRGKNFVFDPRRTDPMIGNGITNARDTLNTSNNQRMSLVGKCIVCSSPHDDYDNGHAPCENLEARCCRCRVLVLVCNDCRAMTRCWGEPEGKDELFCGENGKLCVDEGNLAENVVSEMF